MDNNSRKNRDVPWPADPAYGNVINRQAAGSRIADPVRVAGNRS